MGLIDNGKLTRRDRGNGDTVVQAQTTPQIAPFAASLILAQTDALVAKLTKVCASPLDAELVRQTRSCFRRWRFHIGLFDFAVGRDIATAPDGFSALRRGLGQARDADVLVDLLANAKRIEHGSAYELVMEELTRRQFVRRGRLRRAMGQSNWQQRLADFREQLQTLRPDHRRSSQVETHLGQQLANAVYQLYEATPELVTADSDQLHDVRRMSRPIRFIVGDLLKPREERDDRLSRLFKIAQRLRKSLGRIHDIDVLLGRLAKLKSGRRLRGAPVRRWLTSTSATLRSERKRRYRKFMDKWNHGMAQRLEKMISSVE